MIYYKTKKGYYYKKLKNGDCKRVSKECYLKNSKKNDKKGGAKVGNDISNISTGTSWGTITANIGNRYQLSTGRTARKNTEGTKWQVTPPQRRITLRTIWGKNSWLVHYNGPYNNERYPHVAVGATNINSHRPGEVYTLSNLRRQGNAIMWTVDDLYHTGTNGVTTNAHFTVYYGKDAHLQDLNGFL